MVGSTLFKVDPNKSFIRWSLWGRSWADGR